MQQYEKQLNLDFDLFFNNYLSELKLVIDRIDQEEVRKVTELLLRCYQQQKYLFLFGNGGSGSTASHFVTDFNKVVCQNVSNKFKCVCLNDNIPSLLAISNDLSYDDVFHYQLQNYLSEGDVVIGISGSGNSKNVVKAITYANEKGNETVGIVGFDGGEVKKISKHVIHVCVHQMQYVEDIHLILNHLIGHVLKICLEGGSIDY